MADERDMTPEMLERLIAKTSEQRKTFAKHWRPGKGADAAEIAGYSSRKGRANLWTRSAKLLKDPAVRELIRRNGYDPDASKTTTHTRFAEADSTEPDEWSGPGPDDPIEWLRWQRRNPKLSPTEKRQMIAEEVKLEKALRPPEASLDPLLALQRAVAEELRRDLGEGG